MSQPQGAVGASKPYEPFRIGVDIAVYQLVSPPDHVYIVGKVVAVIGFVIGVMPLVMLTMEGEDFVEATTAQDDAPFIERAFPAIFLCLGLFQMACGFALGVGGIGFSRLKHWGRRTIRAVIWVFIAYCIGFLVFWETEVMALKEELLEAGLLDRQRLGAAIERCRFRGEQ